MPTVRTVLGDLDAASLGVTYFHEHTISQPPRHFRGWEPDLVLDDVSAAVREVQEFMSVGGTCIVDASTIDYGRDVASTCDVARRTGCSIVVTTGYNKAAYLTPEMEGATLEELEATLLRDATVGIAGTGVRAGLIKFGTSYYHMTPAEERAARAACRVQRETGLPLYTHTEAGTLALEQLDLIDDEGVDPGRVCVGHLDRNPDPWYLRQVAARGAFVGIDGVGKVKYVPDSVRVDLIVDLVRRGHADRILVSGDMARRSYLRAYGGGPGLVYIAGRFIPRLIVELRERGFAAGEAEQIGHALLVDNPRRFLATAA